jgi:hypothetical protein
MDNKRAWLTPAVIVAVLAVPFFWRFTVGPASAAGPRVEVPPDPQATCDQACTALASCGHEAAASLGLAPAPDPDDYKPLDVPATRAACLTPCVVAAQNSAAFAETVADCSHCVRSYDCRDVRACLNTCFATPSTVAGR